MRYNTALARFRDNPGRYLPMELCDVILRTNRVRCALNMEILDLLNEESVSGACSGRASL